jgi:Protein of unknown function (DUF2946)
MLSRFHQKIGSILGLLAILMATLAPTVSQALAASRDENTMTGMHCSMPSMQDNAPDNTSDTHSLASHWEACGYCSLLAHIPVVPSVQASLVITVQAIQHRVATRFESVRRVEPLTSAQPRAPPFSS